MISHPAGFLYWSLEGHMDSSSFCRTKKNKVLRGFICAAASLFITLFVFFCSNSALRVSAELLKFIFWHSSVILEMMIQSWMISLVCRVQPNTGRESESLYMRGACFFLRRLQTYTVQRPARGHPCSGVAIVNAFVFGLNCLY